MSTEEKGNSNALYWSIIQGSFRTQVPETHPECIVRKWEAGGESGVKYERSVRALVGKITNVSFYDGDSGGRKFQNLVIELDENEDGKIPTISIGVGTRYAQDLMKKLPNVDFNEEVKLRPFAFQPEGEDKTVTGVEVLQRDGTGQFNTKLTSFFHKKENDKWVAVNGYPVPEGDVADYTTDDWDIFYKTARRFLVNYLKANVAPKFVKTEGEESPRSEERIAKERAEMDEEIDPADIPF